MLIADTAKIRILIGTVLCLVVLISYRGVVGNDFIRFDDPLYVTENHELDKGLSRETAAWAFTTSQASNWHPLTWFSLLLDRELYGRNAPGYHWTNVILHLLGGLILFLALNRMTALLWPSGLVAALFLIHPLHVESVAWVAERKDVLSGLFWMTGLWCYARYAARPGLVRYFWVVLSFACGLLSKPMVVTFPLVLLLLDWWPLGRTAGGKTGWARLVWEKVPLLLLSAAASIVTFLIQKENLAVAPLSAMPLGERLANATVSYAAYLGKTFWPADLAIFYPYHGLPSPGYLLSSLALLILITGASILLIRRRPYIFVGWLWYLGTLVPVIGLVQVGSQAIADRYTYLPLVGVFILVVWGGKDLLDACRVRREIRGFVSGAVLIVLMVLTGIQVGYWKDTPTLFTRALRITKGNFIAHQMLGEEMAKAGDVAGAENHYREAIRVRPSFKQAYTCLGHLLMLQGKKDEAGRLLEKALGLDPLYIPAMKNLGDLRMRQGRTEEAISLYRKAVRLGGDDLELLNNYGVALFFIGEKKEAVLRIREVLRQKPDYPEAQDNLRKILESGETRERIQERDHMH